MTTSSELAFLFRAEGTGAARELPKLAERVRAEEWSYERGFAEALLSTEVASRDAHGGESRGCPTS